MRGKSIRAPSILEYCDEAFIPQLLDGGGGGMRGEGGEGRGEGLATTLRKKG